MRDRSNVRAASIFVLIVAASGVVFGACTETRRNLGEECIKDEDCLAGQCVTGICTGSPITTDEAGVTQQVSTDGGSDASDATDASGSADVTSDALPE